MIEKPTVDYISENDLIDVIGSVLRTLGGRAPKSVVEQTIYDRYRREFSHPYYQELVSGRVPRWRHYIAWAKEQAKHERLVKWPRESGFGIWELTEHREAA